MDWIQVYKEFQHHLHVQGLENKFDPDNHSCTPDARDCTHYHVKNTDYYICEYSGLVHHCTVDECLCKRRTVEHQVCPISGLEYPLDWEDTTDQQHIFDKNPVQKRKQPPSHGQEEKIRKKQKQLHQFNEEILNLKEKEKEEEKKKHEDKIRTLIQNTTLKLLLGPERENADLKRIDQFQRRIKYSFRRYMLTQVKKNKPVFFDFLFNLFLYEDNLRSSLTSPPYSKLELRKRCRMYALKAYDWWTQIKPRVDPKDKYEPQFHTVAYLYTAAKGLRDDLQGPQIVLPKDSFLAVALPPLQSLPNLGIKNRSFTKHQFILQRIMAQIYTEEEEKEKEKSP